MTLSPSTDANSTLTTAQRNRCLTKWLVLVSVSLTALVVVPMTLLVGATWSEMEASTDPLAGLGLVVAILVSVPVIVGAVVSLFGLIWAARPAGPVIAGIGLGVNATVVLFMAWLWLPGLWL